MIVMSTSSRLKVGIFGASGRMGQTIRTVAAEFPALELHLGWTRTSRQWAELACERWPTRLDEVDLVIDVAGAEGFDQLSDGLQDCPRPLVTASTGLDAAHHAMLDRLAIRMPVLWAANLSLGAAMLAALARLAAAKLAPAFDTTILESHHRAKKDAPSGTALMVAESIRAGLPEAQVQVHSIRAGAVVGEHCVQFAGPGERLELIHRADDRQIFARGALHAALWLRGKAAGRYSVEQLWGLVDLGFTDRGTPAQGAAAEIQRRPEATFGS